MFRLTRSFSRFQRPNLMRFSSGLQADDDDLIGGQRDANDDPSRRRSTKRSAKHQTPKPPMLELAGTREQQEFFAKLENKASSKQELAEFREDLNRLTLAECLQKYECSIADALKLDPALQKRIVIKGLIVDSKTREDKVKFKVLDTLTFDLITVFVPKQALQGRTQLGKGSSIVCTGLVFENSETKINSFYCDKIVYANQTTNTYVQYLYKDENTIMDWFRLRNYPAMKFRSTKLAALVRLRSSLLNQIHRLMADEQFVHVTPPILTTWPLGPNQANSGPFTVRNNSKDDYFADQVFLVHESDKHLETMVNAIPQIYTVTHSFSADSTRSRQVTNEALNLEVCQSTDDSLDDLMSQVEYFVKKLSVSYSSQEAKALERLASEKHRFECKLNKTDMSYPRLTYEEALEVLKTREIALTPGEPLLFYHKKIISDYFENYPFFICNFPYEIESDFDTLCIGDKAQRFELIIGRGLVGGRGKVKSHASYEELADKLKQLNCDVDKENVSWYLGLKKKGAVPCTWFALSIDRYLMAVTDLPSLRDAILFPRMPNHCEL